MPTWVKICGNTRAEDAADAARLGAQAVGFIFARSPRQVTPGHVAAMAAPLPPTVERVGVFDSPDPAEILEAAALAGLSTLQLHGGFDPALLETLAAREPRLRLIQVLHWSVDGAPEQAAELAAQLSAQLHRIAELSAHTGHPIRVLVDSKLGAATGGTGVRYDWTAAAGLFRTARHLGIEAIVAGGLRPANVEEAIERLAPWGVDVSSGVESSPGSKNPAAVAEFLARAHGAERP